MTRIQEPTMLGKITAAVRPLTSDDQFRLNTIAYCPFSQIYVVELISDDIIIYFEGYNLLSYPATICHIYVSRSKTWYSAAELFPAMGIKIRFGRPDPGEWARPELGYFPRGDPQIVTDLDVLDFYQDLERLCVGVAENLHKIQLLFHPDNRDKKNRQNFEEFNEPIEGLVCFQTPYPIPDIKTNGVLQPGKPIPDFEDILKAKEPLAKLNDKSTFTIHLGNGRVDVLSYILDPACRLLFHSKEDGNVDLYFIFQPWNHLQKIYPEFMNPERNIVFSGRNIFKMLEIDCSCPQKGFIEDIHGYCQCITDNFETINFAFTGSTIEKSYNKLKKTQGNNENEVIGLLASVYDLIE